MSFEFTKVKEEPPASTRFDFTKVKGQPMVTKPVTKGASEKTAPAPPKNKSVAPEFTGNIFERARQISQWQKEHPISEEEYRKRLGRLAAQPGEKPSLRNIERAVARPMVETAFLTPLDAPRPATGKKGIDVAANLLGTALGFIAPMGAGGMAFKASETAMRTPRMIAAPTKLAERLTPVAERIAPTVPRGLLAPRITPEIIPAAERLTRGATAGGIYGAMRGAAESDRLRDIPKAALEDAALFAAMDVILPGAGRMLVESKPAIALTRAAADAFRRVKPPVEIPQPAEMISKPILAPPAEPGTGRVFRPIWKPGPTASPVQVGKSVPEEVFPGGGKRDVEEMTARLEEKINLAEKPEGPAIEEFRQKILTGQEKRKLKELQEEDWEKIPAAEGMEKEPTTVSWEALKERELVAGGKRKRPDVYEDTMSTRPELPVGSQTVSKVGPTARRVIIQRLQKVLDIPVRVGRYDQKALGIFKTGPEVVRTKLAEDLPVIAHEAGHYLDKLFGIRGTITDSAIRQELITLGKEQSQIPAKQFTEGIAEFTRRYLSGENMQKLAPQFQAHFENITRKEPDLWGALQKFREDFSVYGQADPADQFSAAMSFFWEKPEKEPIGVRKAVKQGRDWLYTRLVDELKPLYNSVQAITGGKQLPTEADPFKQAWLIRDNGRLAHTFLWKGQIDEGYNVIGPSLKEIIKPLRNRQEYRLYGEYAEAKQVKELYELVRAGKIEMERFPVTEQATQAKIEQAQRLGLIDKFEAINQQRINWHNNLLQVLERSGLLSESSAQQIINKYKNYAPMYRVFEREKETISGVKGRVGSGRTLVDPIESAVKQAYMFTSLAMRNNVGRLLAELGETFPGAGKYIERIPAEQYAVRFKLKEIGKTLENAGIDVTGTNLEEITATLFRAGAMPKAKPDEYIVTIWREGKPEFYQVNKDIHDYLTHANASQLNWAFKILSYPANLLRTGATVTIDFALRNPLRDLGSAFVFEKIMPWDLTKAIFAMAKKTDLYTKWKAAGGDQATFWSVDRDYLKQDVRRMINDRWQNQVKQNILHPVDALYKIREVAENVTRMATFGRSTGWGRKVSREALDEAAIAARDVTVDFRRYGTWGKEWNMASAFANPAIQGWDKFLREMRKQPLGVSLRAINLVTLPSLALYFMNHDNPAYQELPEWRKDLFWNIPIDNGTRFLMWPKPFELGILFGSIPERIARALYDNDPHAFNKLGKTMVSTLPGILPTAFEAPLEWWANKSFFTGMPTVPMAEQKLPPEAQYGPYTTETAKLLGEKTGLSPRKIEQLVYSTAASWGRYGLSIGDSILEAAGITSSIPKPAKQIEERMVLRSFFTRPKAGQASSIDQFYQEYEKASQMEEKRKKMREEGVPLKPLTEEEKTLQRRLPTMKAVEQKLSKYRKRAREIQKSRALSPEKKSALIRQIEAQEINVARKAMGKTGKI